MSCRFVGHLSNHDDGLIQFHQPLVPLLFGAAGIADAVGQHREQLQATRPSVAGRQRRQARTSRRWCDGDRSFPARTPSALATLDGVADVTQILAAIEQGNPHAAAELLPLVYDELRKLAAARLADEKPGQTLQATALVHEAYLRLVGADASAQWDNRGHFFAAAAESMRRILVEQARHKATLKRGGQRERQEIEPDDLPVTPLGDPLEILAVHEALDLLAAEAPRKAEVVKLRYFLGCTMTETAEVLGVAIKTAEEDWTYVRAWLRRQWLREREKSSSD